MASKPGILGRGAAFAALAACVGFALIATACGGGGEGYAAKPMVLVEYLYVDRALTPSFPTGTQTLPRNAQLIFRFSELADPNSVNDQTIQVRFGANFQSVPTGSFQVSGADVIFDPTVTAQGTPNPEGFPPLTQFTVDLPGQGTQNDVVRNLDNDPLLNSFFTTFATAEGYLRELDPPQIVRAFFLPAQDPLTKEVKANAILGLEFDEAMAPASFVQALGATVGVTDTIDVRYSDLPDPNLNQANNVENVPVSGTFTHDTALKTWYFTPTFGWGNAKLTFYAAVLQGVTDLAGNKLINPRSFGPYVCDGSGTTIGKFISESFDSTTDMDPSVTDADWGSGNAPPGILQGSQISTRNQTIDQALMQTEYNGGVNWISPDPLNGALLNQYVTGISPPTSMGRRVMLSFSDSELGAAGSVTQVSWGADSNATFAAQYPEVILRIGFQKNASLALSPTFSGNYEGSPLIMYRGAYSVQQAASNPNQGYIKWPAPTSYFEYDPGTSAQEDRVIVFDASVQEGDTWQQMRGWIGLTGPIGIGVPMAGVPNRRLYATYEEDVANPPTNALAGILNPEPSMTDTRFTLTKRISYAQSLFYTPGATDAAGNAYPAPYSDPTRRTFGVKSDYLPAILNPAVQTGGAEVDVAYQGAFVLDPTSGRSKINTSFPSTPFTASVNDCDGFPYLRWRLTLTSNLISQKVARLTSISIPVVALP